jgi:hypothetical protein
VSVPVCTKDVRLLPLFGWRESSVGIGSRLLTRLSTRFWLGCWQEQGTFSSTKVPRWTFGPHRVPSSIGAGGSLPEDKTARSCNCAALKMSGAIPPFPPTPTWYKTQVLRKYADPDFKPRLAMCDLQKTRWHWGRVFSQDFGFPLSVSFHQCSILFHSPIVTNDTMHGPHLHSQMPAWHSAYWSTAQLQGFTTGSSWGNFTSMWPCIVTNSLLIKPTRCTNFSDLFWKWNSTCFRQFLCPPSGVIHCTLSNGVCHTGL